MDKSDLSDIIIQTALERFRPHAANKVKESLCAYCPDRRCEKGIRCNTYHLLVEAIAWEIASDKNN